MRELLLATYLITLLFLPQSAQAQQTKARFDLLSVDQGLSSGNANCVYQDHLGYIWIGTEDGLNKYDGYDVTIYNTVLNDSTTLPSNRVSAIHEDVDGNLWVGTNGGLALFDRDFETFKSYKSIANDSKSISGDFILDMHIGKDNELWIGTNSGLSKWNSSDSSFTNFQHVAGDQSSIPPDRIRSITTDQQGRIWISSDSHVSRMNEDGKSFRNYPLNDPSGDVFIAGSQIEAIFCDSRNQLWIGTFDQGVTVWDLNSNSAVQYTSDPGISSTMTHNYVHCIGEDQKGNVWVGTDTGLNQHLGQGKFNRYRNNPNNPHTISSDIIRDLIFDNDGRMWTSLQLGGVCIYDEDKYGFQLFRSRPNDLESLSSNITGGYTEDALGNFYVATDGAGLNYYDRSTGKFTHWKNDPQNSNSLSSDKVLAVEVANDGRVWIGMWGGGINVFDPETERFRRYMNDPDDPTSNPDNMIIDIHEDRFGNIWGATFRNGLIKYNAETDDFTTFRNIPSDPESIAGGSIGYIEEDNLGNLWLVHWGTGISYYDQQNGRFTNYQADGNENSLPTNSVEGLTVDSKGQVWIGTNGFGLILFDRDNGVQDTFTVEDGLPANGVVSIIETDVDIYWLATNKGLSRFDARNEKFKNYFASDGLQSNQFMPRNKFKLSTGELLFGGNNGFNLFNPRNLSDNEVVPRVYITDFKILNQSVEVTADGILQQSIHNTKELVLNHDQNIFSFDFIGINYRHTQKNQYQYILEGLYDEWVNIGTERKASFAGLEPGDYTFKVLASNSDGVWAEEPVAIDITVTPPFWATWWFRSLIIVLVVSGLTAFYKIRSRQLKRDKELLKRKVEEATSKVNKQNEELLEQSDRLREAIEETNYVVSKAVESGDFSARIDSESKTGEWKALGESINLLFESVVRPFNTINKIVNYLAEGDLRHRYIDDAKGEIERLSTNLNTAMDNMSGLLSRISMKAEVIRGATDDMLVTSEDMNVSTGEIASAIAEMSKGAQEQVMKIDESSSLIEGIMQSSSEMGNQAEAINNAAKEGVKKSINGLEQVTKLETNMHDILDYSDKTNHSIETLQKRSDEISSVLRIIKDIASQTNLLALNAAIEAAQAGEAGRGFAVVAEEIRKLAEDSKKSAGEIEELVNGVQHDTSSTAEIIAEMSKKIEVGGEATETSKKAFEEISQYYQETLHLSEQIVQATKQQSDDVGFVVKIINGVVVIAEQTASGTEETASSSSELSSGMINYASRTKEVSGITNELSDEVSKFKLKDFSQAG